MQSIVPMVVVGVITIGAVDETLRERRRKAELAARRDTKVCPRCAERSEGYRSGLSLLWARVHPGDPIMTMAPPPRMG